MRAHLVALHTQNGCNIGNEDLYAKISQFAGWDPLSAYLHWRRLCISGIATLRGGGGVPCGILGCRKRNVEKRIEPKGEFVAAPSRDLHDNRLVFHSTARNKAGRCRRTAVSRAPAWRSSFMKAYPSLFCSSRTKELNWSPFALID